MENKSIILGVLVLALIALGIGALYLYNTSIQSDAQQSQNQVMGKVMFGITDAAASMGNISSVLVTVDRAQLHNQSEGWVTVSNSNQQFDLLALKQSQKIVLLGQADVKAGTYNQMRLNVSKVVVVENGVAKEAKLPSSEVKIMGDVLVSGNSTATAVFDFIADESLHVTGNGQFIFAPVVKLESRSNANVQVATNNELKISGGSIKANKSVGMDISGQVKENFVLNQNTKIDVVGNVLKITTTAENDTSIKVKSEDAVKKAIESGSIDTAISVQLIALNNQKMWQISGLKNLSVATVLINASTGAVVSSQ